MAFEEFTISTAEPGGLDRIRQKPAKSMQGCHIAMM